MSRRISMILQGILLALHWINMHSEILPALWRPRAMIVLAGIQSVLVWVAHDWNADGTPASVAFKPE